MPRDPDPLYAIAAELDRRAVLLRARAGIVGATPGDTRWSSLGARVWAEGAAHIRVLLLRSADEVEATAARIRARAAQVCSWD